MNPGTLETPRYAPLRKGGKVLGRLALWVQLGFLIMGMGLFLNQARDLLSDAQFTWGERRVMGVIALVTRRNARGRAAPRGLAGSALSRGLVPKMRAARARPGSPLLRLPARGSDVPYGTRFQCSIV